MIELDICRPESDSATVATGDAPRPGRRPGEPLLNAHDWGDAAAATR